MKDFLSLAAQTFTSLAIAGASISVLVAGIATLAGRDAFDVGVAFVVVFLFWLIPTFGLSVMGKAQPYFNLSRGRESFPGRLVHLGRVGASLGLYLVTGVWKPFPVKRPRLAVPVPDEMTVEVGPWSLTVLYYRKPAPETGVHWECRDEHSRRGGFVAHDAEDAALEHWQEFYFPTDDMEDPVRIAVRPAALSASPEWKFFQVDDEIVEQISKPPDWPGGLS